MSKTFDDVVYSLCKNYTDQSQLGFKSVKQVANGFEIEYVNGTKATYTVQNMHQHTNMPILSVLNKDVDGNLTFNGKKITNLTSDQEELLMKFSLSTDNKLLFDGKPIEGGGSTDADTFKEVTSISEMTNKNNIYILNTEKNITENVETFLPKYVCGANNMLTDMPGEYNAVHGIGFKCEQGVKYTVTKSTSTNRFRLAIMTSEPETWTYHQPVDYTIVDSSDTSLLQYTFTCDHTGYCLFTYSNEGVTTKVTVKSSGPITVGCLYKYNDISKEFCELELDNLPISYKLE